jgi:hypothetical protein
MKQNISQTKINKSNRSLITTIPHTIAALENLSNTDSIRWYYEIVNNKHIYTIEFIKDSDTSNPSKPPENTPANIDQATEKPEKNNTLTETTQTPSPNNTAHTKSPIRKTIIKDLHETTPEPDEQLEIFEELKDKRKHMIYSTDNKYQVSIQKNKKSKTGNQTFKLCFKTKKEKHEITSITFGSIDNTYHTLQQLATMNQNQITNFIIEHNPKAIDNLIGYGLKESESEKKENNE